MAMMGKSPEAATDAGWVVLGVITKPKGVRGQVRIASFTERPGDLVAYGPLYDGPGGRIMDVTLRETLKGSVVVAQIAGVTDRDAAEALRGVELHIPRSALPVIDGPAIDGPEADGPEADGDEYYHADLVGLEAVSADGETIGRVAALHNFGAGDILEVMRQDGDSFMLPFDSDSVPEIDIPGGRVVIAPPLESEAEKDESKDET